eukprot:2613278-Pyramimonas_sp.AAC.1
MGRRRQTKGGSAHARRHVAPALVHRNKRIALCRVRTIMSDGCATSLPMRLFIDAYDCTSDASIYRYGRDWPPPAVTGGPRCDRRGASAAVGAAVQTHIYG